MSDEHPSAPPGHIDEYFIRELGPARFEVYRVLGQMELHYCECLTPDAALVISRALTLISRLEGRIVQTFSFVDGSIFLVAQGDEAEKAFLKALPFLQGDK